MSRSTRHRAAARLVAGTVAALAFFAGEAAAHTGSLRLGQDPPPVPTWLVVMTGGGVIGLSFLFASLVTDHDLIREINDRGIRLGVTAGLADGLRRELSWVGVLLLAATVVVGLVGPRDPTTNAAILFVWAAWWAGYTATVYLLGNSWPLVNPWRALARAVPFEGGRSLSPPVARWLPVVGLLGLVLLEVVTPVAGDPRLLAGVVVAYTVATVAGATVVGVDAWFERVDPIARLFACYGRIAPIQRTEDGLRLRLPGAAATEPGATAGLDPAFVVAVLWVTTYDGLVSTPAWRALAEPVVGAGVPALALYVVATAGGYLGFLGLYRLGARYVRRSADTYLGEGPIAEAFAPSLLPIAAGYHAAHFLAYVVSLLPALVVVALDPLSPPASVPVLGIPGWFGPLGLLFILVGHVLAIWIAHSVSFDVFAGRLQPLRSQYPLVALMIAYTMTSMWIVIQPTVEVPFVG